MIVTELSPRSLDTIEIDADRDAARAWIAARYGSAEAETVRLNMITSLTGSAVGGDGTSETLTGGADRLILSAIRAAADAVHAVGGLFVLETVSVIVQVASFKMTGKRIFRMAPLHHHFEQKGWAESTIVIRFWIIATILALLGLATLKLR